MKFKLTKEEKALVDSVERGEWVSVPITPQKMKQLKASAAHTLKLLRKDARLSIRIPAMDLLQLREIAAKEGLPYQTFVSSLLHKYLSGRLVEKK